MFKKVILILALACASPAYAESPYEKCQRENRELVKKVEELLASNEELIEKLRTAETSTPEIQLEDLTVVVDKEGRIFIKDELKGKLQVGELSYDITIKLNTTIAKTPKSTFGFRLRPKAYILSTYELNSDDKMEQYTSGAVGFDLLYYKYVNINLLIGNRIYGPAVGVEITDHFGLVGGVGKKYNDDKALFVGASFDF